MSGLGAILKNIPGVGTTLAALAQPIEAAVGMTPAGAVATTALDAVGSAGNMAISAANGAKNGSASNSTADTSFISF